MSLKPIGTCCCKTLIKSLVINKYFYVLKNKDSFLIRGEL